VVVGDDVGDEVYLFVGFKVFPEGIVGAAEGTLVDVFVLLLI